MYAECARQSCAQQATVLLAFDPRGARAWLYDLVDADPSMGLMLCGDHADTTTVPMSWSFVDERSADLDKRMHDEVDGPPPSFDDIFPPRSAREPDPYGLDPDLEERASAHEAAAPDGAGDPVADDDRYEPGRYDADLYDDAEYSEAVELLAPELPASGTDGAAIRQPQLPMISTPAREHTDGRTHPHYTRDQPRNEGPGAGHVGDFLFTEDPEDRLPDAGPRLPGYGPEPTVTARPHGTGERNPASPLFETTVIQTPRMAPPTSPLLSRAFRSAHTD